MKKQIILLTAAVMMLVSGCAQKNVPNSSSTAAPAPHPSSSVVSSSSSPSSSSSTPASSSNTVHESADPKVISLYTQASDDYTKKNYTSAIKKCDAALAIDPLCYQALNIKGAAQYYASGDPQQGLPFINKCIELNPNYQFGYFNKALIYKGKKDWDTSIGLFNKVIEIAPDNAWAYYGISTIYADRNMVPQSLQYLKKAIEIDTTSSVKETARVQNHYDRMRGNPDFQALVK